MFTSNRIIGVIVVLFSTVAALAQSSVAPFKNARVVWDDTSRSVVFQHGGYARMIRLADNRLLAVCENNGIDIAFSGDMGKTWSIPKKIVTNIAKIPACTPDVIQLRNGIIIVAYNLRPTAPYSPERKFGIRCKRSTDNGNTWSEAIFVNDARHTFDDGCWEPSMIELPTGELQLFFADEAPYTASNEQQISVCSSSDEGITWDVPQQVSFRKGFRDGMPVSALLADRHTVAVAIEDNGVVASKDFVPAIIMRDVSAENGTVTGCASERYIALDTLANPPATGGAPYLRVLPRGNTILSWQSKYDNAGKLTMFVAVGDEHARNFCNFSTPFKNVTNGQVLWNSIAVTGADSIDAIGGFDGRVEMIRGIVVNTAKQ